MRSSKTAATASVLAVIGALSGSARAQDAGTAQNAGTAQDAGTAQNAGTAQDAGAKAAPQMSAAEQEMMQKYMQAATPGPEHQKLAKLAGTWKMDVTAWMTPGAPPEKSEGTAEFKTILGGRYLLQEVKGTMGGQPFEGRGTMGFDNVTKERFATWTDSMSTGLLVMRGKCPADAKKCTTRGQGSDAVAGKMVSFAETTTMTDDNHFTFELRGPGPDGKQYKMMEIKYTRQ
ncbi:MAG TPA: DUF1579 domain-containing protein [Myxococcales bacterium]|nr:DUF1579 domain-containing protein [Myxococcales bacterium]